jgi:hypothetical protein
MFPAATSSTRVSPGTTSDKNSNDADEKSFPLKSLGSVAAQTLIPVIGCAEGPSLFSGVKDVGMLVTAYDDAFADSYAECKRRKTEGGFLCMAPVFPKVSLLRDYQYWTAAFKDYIDQCLAGDRRRNKNPCLVIQRCRGSESAHTMDVWTRLLSCGGFFDLFDTRDAQTSLHFEAHHDAETVQNHCADDGLTLFYWDIYRQNWACGDQLVCSVFFRGGWEPDRIGKLPRCCAKDHYKNTTVFLLGTCCRFQNCDEGDVLIPRMSVGYDTKKSVLDSRLKCRDGLGNNDYFARHKDRIWSQRNLREAAKVVWYGMQHDVDVCGETNHRTFDPVGDATLIKGALHIQLTDIFEAPKGDALDTAVFTRKTHDANADAD